MKNELKPFWRNFFGFNRKFGFFLIPLICIPRFMLLLNANKTANYKHIGLIMLASAGAPFIFLNKNGRKTIGLSGPVIKSWLLSSFILGLI